MNLESLLLALAAFGRPRLGIYGSGGGWNCSVDMTVNATGAKFEVDSGFDHPSPQAAAHECLVRVRKILESFGTDLHRLEALHLALESGNG